MIRWFSQRSNDSIYKQLVNLDTKHDVFNIGQKRILNLGYSPGLWLHYMIQKLSSLHGIDAEKIATKCHILNFDILFKSVPIGVSTIQGNIFSKKSHELVNQHFKDLSIYETLKLNDETLTYFNKEQQEIALEKIAQKMNILDYKIDLVLSDLSQPLPQKSGFYDNTETNPYLRYNNNKGLNHSILNSRAVFDLGDAANILTLNLLKPGGKYLIKLNNIKKEEELIDRFFQKLSPYFDNIKENYSENDCIFLCEGKYDIDIKYKH